MRESLVVFCVDCGRATCAMQTYFDVYCKSWRKTLDEIYRSHFWKLLESLGNKLHVKRGALVAVLGGNNNIILKYVDGLVMSKCDLYEN